jgi:hypothetical protein
LVVDGWNSVVEVQADGAVAARHELPLPSDGVVSALRTATDKQGKRYYAAFLTAQQQFHVFDGDWKPLLSFPAAGDAKHEGIGDVQFADLDGNGTLEMAVGYWGDVGLQYVTLDGKRTWTDRTLQYVLRLATTGADGNQRRLLAANSHGTVGVFNAEGKAGDAITVAGRPLQTIYAADLNSDGQPELCVRWAPTRWWASTWRERNFGTTICRQAFMRSQSSTLPRCAQWASQVSGWRRARMDRCISWRPMAS